MSCGVSVSAYRVGSLCLRNIPGSRHIQQYVQNAAACPRLNKIPRHLSLRDNIMMPIHCCHNVTGTRHTLRYINLLPNCVCVFCKRWKIHSCKRVFLHVWDTQSVSRRGKLRQLSSSLKKVIFPPMPPHVLVDFVVLPPGHGRSVTDFRGWDAHEAQLCCPDDVSGDIGGYSARRALKPKFC